MVFMEYKNPYSCHVGSFFSKLHCRVDQIYVMPYDGREVTPVGFEPTQLALVELESTPFDHSGKVSMVTESQTDR